MINLSIEQLISTLKYYIDCAFDNEEEFLKEFWKGRDDDMLLNLYMGDEKCKFNIMTDSGTTITSTIETDEYIEWCENTKPIELTKEHDAALWQPLEKSTTLISR